VLLVRGSSTKADSVKELMFMRFVLVLLLGFAFFTAGCSSDSDGGGSNSTAGSASTGGSAGTELTCKYSNCPHEPVVWDKQEQCDALMMSPCYTMQKAWLDCKLAKETCNADGKIETSSIASCGDLFTTLNDCLAANQM
jgi:hypothetical protein